VIPLAKESYQTPHIDDYNKRHPNPVEAREWFSEFIPFDIYGSDIPQETVRLLNARFREYEVDAQEMFDTNVRSAFEDFLVSYVDEELLDYLPRKPEPVDWPALPIEKKNAVNALFRECKEHGLTKKTIRKKIRRLLEM